jgi:hypothetical protein
VACLQALHIVDTPSFDVSDLTEVVIGNGFELGRAE